MKMRFHLAVKVKGLIWQLKGTIVDSELRKVYVGESKESSRGV